MAPGASFPHCVGVSWRRGAAGVLWLVVGCANGETVPRPAATLGGDGAGDAETGEPDGPGAMTDGPGAATDWDGETGGSSGDPEPDVDESSTTDPGPEPPDDDADSSGSSGGTEGGTVRGSVISGFTGHDTVAGVTVAMWSDPMVSTVTGADGSFELDGVPDGEVLLVAERDGYVGGLRGVRIEGGSVDGFEVPVFEEENMQTLMQLLFPHFDVNAPFLLVSSTAPGATVSASVGASSLNQTGYYFAWGENGEILADVDATAYPQLPAVAFFNAPPANTGQLDVTALGDNGACAPALSLVPPLVGGYITQFDVDCG